MKRKFFPALVIVGALFLTACQEDDTMDELIQDANTEAFADSKDGSGTSTQSGGDDMPGSNN